MATSGAKIAFTFPYRWLVDAEDKKFLNENLVRMANKNKLIDNKLPNQSIIQAYAAVLQYHAYEPVKIPLTKNQIEKAFKKVFPGAKCIDYKKFFVQTQSSTALPVMELQIFY